MAFTVFQDFMAYKSGYYVKSSENVKQMGGHATTVIGWENTQYVLSVNSWGTKWGEAGRFKMQKDCCGLSYFIAEVSSTQRALPLPAGPKTGAGAAPGAGGAGGAAHRRRRGQGFFGKLRDRFHDLPGEETETKNGMTLDDGLDRLHVILEIAGVDCARVMSNASGKAAVERAASLAIVGKLSMLLPTAVQDLKGTPQRVSMMPCGSSSAALPTTGNLDSIWDCGGEPSLGNSSAISFYVILPPGVSTGEAQEKVSQCLAPMKRRISDALGWSVNDKSDRECYSKRVARLVSSASSVGTSAAADTGIASSEASLESSGRPSESSGPRLPFLFLGVGFLFVGLGAFLVFYSNRRLLSEDDETEEDNAPARQEDVEGQAPLMSVDAPAE